MSLNVKKEEVGHEEQLHQAVHTGALRLWRPHARGTLEAFFNL